MNEALTQKILDKFLHLVLLPKILLLAFMMKPDGNLVDVIIMGSKCYGIYGHLKALVALRIKPKSAKKSRPTAIAGK